MTTITYIAIILVIGLAVAATLTYAFNCSDEETTQDRINKGEF